MIVAESVDERVNAHEMSGAERRVTLSEREVHRAGAVVVELIRSGKYISDLDRSLEEAEEPKPAIGVSISRAANDSDLPIAFVGYGKTELRKGLQPITNVKLDSRGGREIEYGIALPMDPATQRSVTYFPYPDKEDRPVVDPQEIGWWQQWRPDRFTVHEPGKETYVREYPDGDVSFNSKPFSAWQIPLFPPMPFIIEDAEFAADEAGRVMRVVRELPGSGSLGSLSWRATYEREGCLHQHFTAVGKEAVKAALEALQDESIGDSTLPKPLTDMFDTVAADLNLGAS